MATENRIVEQILAKEKAKGATMPKDIKPTQGMSIAEKIDAKVQGTQQQLADLATSIGANAEAMQGALAHRDYEKTKAKTAKMLDESTLGTKPYASSEDVQREQMQTFMDKKAEEARARGMKDYLDSTIGAWSADRVSSIVGGLADADAERIRRGAERVSQLKQEGETPKVAELSIPRAEVDVQLPKSITEANMQMDAERTKGVSKISFSGLADRSKKEASKVVKDYLAENPHMEANAEMLEAYVANNIYNDTFKWKLENDEQFFADAYEATTGKSYAEYKREVDNEARAKLQSMKRELEAMNETLKKKRDENRTNAGQSRSAFSAAWSDLKNAFGGNIEEIENLIDGIDNVLEGSFSSGFDKGFDFDRMATVGLSGVFTEGEMANALMKANNGESLTEEEENYVRIHQYAQELEQLKKVREKYAEQMYDKFLGFNLNSIGEGVGTTVEMMPAFAGGMTATGLIGKFADIGGKAALKSALKAGGKELFKYGVKTTGKLGYNFGLAKARGLAAAPFMPSTYNTYLESLNSAYSFDDNGNLTYKPVDKTQSYFGAVFSTANEISSEYLGIGIGKVVGWGARGVGRMAANTKIAETLVDAGKKARKYLPKLTPQAKVAMRTLGVQADPISETLSEALGDIMTSYEQSMIGMDVDMSQYGTFDYWMTLAGVTLAYGGSIAAMGAVKSYADVRSVVKERDAILGKISNRNLYNTLLAVSTSDDVVLASSALADFDWEGNDISPEDRRLAEAYAVADLNVKIMEGAVEEGSRLDKFRGTIEGVRNIVYQGKAGEYSDKIFEAEVDGKKVFVVNGFEENSTTNLYVVVDAATGEKSSVDKSKVKLTREVDVDTYIQEAYTNAFSLESEKTRVKDVREKALQMDNPTEKDVQRVASTLDITLPKVGDAVMLASGNMGSVTERLSPTEYAVQDLSGATYKVHFTDILSTDKLTATAQGALARGEASTPISTTEASVAEASAEDVTSDVTEPATDENGIVIGSEVTVDGRVGTVRARTENGDYVVSFEDESGNYENAEVEVYTPAEMTSLMGVAPMPTVEGTPTTTEVATTDDGSVDIEQMSAEDAAKVLVERAGTIEEAITQVKQVIETVTEERRKMAKAEKKASLNDIGKKSAELQALDARLEFYGEVLGVLEGMLAEQQKQTMTEAQSIAEEAGDATTEAPNDGDEKSAETPTSGLIRNGAEMKFTDNVIRMVDFIAQRLGITVEFVDGLKNDAGQPINGDIKGKHVRISTKGDRGVKFIVGHEFFHRIKDNVDEVTYNKYVDALKEFFGEERWEEALNAQKRKYRAHNVAVAKKSMEGMTPEEVAAIAQQLGVSIEGLSAEDAKAAVARVAMRKAEQGDEVARALFPTMLTYSDDLMLEETAADISGEMVANLDAFSNFVEDNKSEYAIIRGMHKALRYINDMFASFGQTTRQRKVKRLIKNLESIMAEAVKNEREGVKKAREDAKKKGVQGNDARFSLSSTPMFFSNAQYAVQNIKQEKATPEQWHKMIEKNGGLKAGEDKWLGLSDWLKASDKKTLTKDEVLQYIAENDIQIEEVEYGDVEDSARFKELYREYNALYYEYGRNSERAFEEMLANYGDDFGIAFEAAGDELWVRDSEAAEVFVDINSVNDTRLQYTTDGINNKREIALVVPTIEPWNTSDKIHFGDAGEGRAVAWIRFGESTDADGKRVLVIDEIQSKRHQDGREKGYRDVEAEKQEKAERERELTEVVLPRLAELNQLYNEKYGVGKWRDTEYDRQWRPRRVYRFLTPEEQAEHEAIAQRATELQMPMPRRDGVPSAPFEKNWAELAFKRMLRYAAENGYDYVAWTTGDQQADRYNLAKVFKSISRKDFPFQPERTFVLDGNNLDTLTIDENGNVISFNTTIAEAIGKPLTDVVGKDMAEKMMSLEDGDTISGDGLRIGGEGMKAFYDQMLPSFVKKYTKKWGAEVGEVTMPDLEENNTMHAVNVTDSMRESVMQGQPKFSLPSLVGVHNLSLDKLRKVIKMGGLANPSVAVIDVDKQTHVDYGEYSLILPKNMVDARQGKNAGTWAGDAWTPTYPQVVKRMNDDKAISRFYKDIDALPEAMRSRVRLDFDSFMDGRSANALAYWYLVEKGNAPEMVLVPSRYSNDVTNAVSEATKGSFSMFNLTPEERAKCLDAYIAVKFDGDRAAFEAEMQARIERLAETIETKKSDRVKKWAQDTIDSIKEYGFDYDDVATFIRDVEYDAREKGKVNVDATILAAQERINESNLAAEYDAWRNNLDERYGIDEFIFDGYTNSGNRRYLPHTVENASKWMKKQGRQGAVATFPSFGTFVAVSIPKMTTLESIRKRKALLGKSKEEYDAFREKWENVYYELGKKLQPDAKSFEDYGYWRLIEAVGQKNPKEFIKKEYGVELSEEDMTQLNEMLNAIRTEYPARYFETKFERPLQLSDFTAAVVPNDIPLDVESRLKDANVEVIEYEKGDNASRAEAMQKASEMENVRFSLIGEVGAAALDMAEEATTRLDNLAVAREMETAGEDAKAIRMATGWERGADGLWRYEIMDAGVNLYDGDENTIRKKIEVAEEEEKDFMQQSKADTKELRERTNTYLAEMREKYGVAEGEETDAMTEEEIAHLQSLTNKEIEFEDYKERRRNELYNRRMALEAQLAYVSVKNSEAPAEIATTRLGHILQGEYAEQIFKAYPTLRDMGVKFVTSIRDNAYAAYVSSGSMKWLELNVKKTTLNDVAFYIAHEIQHAIQDIEGFANGGNLSTITSQKERILEAVAKATDYKMPVYDNYGAEDLENALTKNMQSYRPDTAYGVVYKDAIQSVAERFGYEDIYALINDWDNIEGKYDTYKRIAGEVEARNVSARINMTPEERRATLLSETEDVAREDQIFLREGAEMAMAEGMRLPKEEYAKLSSIIMTRQYTYGRPSFDYAFTDGGFYVYDYLGDGVSIVNFAMPIVGNEEIIDVIYKAIDNGTINSSGSLDTFIEEIQSGKRGDIDYNANALKKYERYRGVHIHIPSSADNYTGGVFEVGSVDSRRSATRGESGNTNESGNQELTTRHSLITPEMDATYLDAVERGDMATAQKMVMEAAKLAMPNTKVVDEDGNPKVVYHGDRKKARYIFSTDTFFTPKEEYAKRYTNGTGEVYATFLDIKRPFDIRDKKAYDIFTEFRGGRKPVVTTTGAMDWGEYSYEDLQEYVEDVAPNEYDGFILDEGADPDGNGGVIHRGLSFVPFAPNQIKSADPVTYDDAGNVIPLSERFNPEKEDIRYSISSEEDARFERKVAFLTGLVREYNIPLPTFIAQTKEEFKRMALDYGIPEKEIYEDKCMGCYASDDDIIIINGGLIKKPSDINNTLLHEYAHYVSDNNLKEEIAKVAQTLNDSNVKAMHTEFFEGNYDYLDKEGIIDEVVSYMVGYLQIEKTKPTFEGKISAQEHVDAWKKEIENSKYSNDVKDVFYTALPLVKENLEYQKKQYGAEKANTIVIARKQHDGNDAGGSTKAQIYGGAEYRPFKAEPRVHEASRGGEGADAQEVTRFMLPDPDPSDAFYDEIPIFDEQGNEIDITTLSSEEAQAILDSKVRQMLEAEYEHNISAIRKEAREARQAIIDHYNEEKGKRKKNNKPSRTNAARIDDILGDKPFESLPLEDQALILIATGRAKIRWSDKGTQRGLASELGLKGSKGDKHTYRSIWSGATKSFNEVVHDWWESIGGQERGIDDQDLRNALIEAFQSVQSSKDAMGEIIRKYDDLSAERDAALAEVDRMEEKDLHEAKAAYEQHFANFELSEGEERASYHDRAAQFFGNQNLSRTDEILEDLVFEMERQKRKIERLKAENKDIYTPLAEGIQKSKDIILHALERLRMFAGMEEVDLNDVARLVGLVKAARSQRQVENLGAQATALVQRISIKKAKANLYRLLSLKLSNTDIIHKMLAESDKWTKEERDAILKHLWKVSRNGLRVSKAVHRDTKEIFDELKRLVYEFRKEKLKGLDNEQKASAIDGKLAELEQELHPEVIYDSEGNVQDNSNLPTDFNADNKHLAKTLFKTYLKMLAAEAKYRNASKILSEKIENKEQTGNAYADVVATREDYLHALKQLNSTLEDLILKGKDDLRDWNAQKEKHEIEIRRMGIEAIGGEKADSQGKRSKWGARQRARLNTSVNAPYWTFETVLEKIDHKTPYKRGKFYTYFMDKWSDANDDLITRYMAHFEQLGEVMSKCFPNDATFLKMKRNPYRMFQYIMRKAESTPIGTITYKEGDSERQMVLNVANAMYIIAMWRQPRYQEAMKERGITQQDVDTLMQSIKSKDAGFIDFMDWVNEKFLPSTRLEYDVVFRKMNGGSMPKEVNYFPARVAAHQEVDLANIENGAMPTTPTALKDRTSHNIMPEMGMDYFKVLEAHVEDMDKWAAYAELTADLNVLLSSDEFRRRLNEYMGGLGGDGGGKGSLYELFKQTSLIATGLYRGDAGMQAIFGKVQKAWATSNIAFRGWTALKQISSVTTGMFDNMRFYKHALKAASIGGIYSEIKDAMAISPSLRQRWKSGAVGMEALAREAQRADGYTVHRGAYEKSMDAIGDAIKWLVRKGMTPNAAVDLLSCSIIVNSVYETEIARLTGGKREATEEEKRAAVRKAERAFNTTQQSSEGAYLAPVQANPAFGVLTTYMNASFALHRKRMAGVKELWKLMTSKEYRRFIKDEYGVDAAKMSAVDAMKDIMSGIAGELSFVAMGWGLMEFMSWVNSWFNDDDDDDDTAAAKAEFAETWWQSFLNGYLFGSVVTSIMQGFDASLTPAYDELFRDVKGIFDGKGDARWEVVQVAFKYFLGIDLQSLYKAGVGFRNLFEDDERVGAILMLLNAPERYVKAFVGDRREGETMEEYQTRIVRFYTLFDDVKFSDYFDENGKYIGEDAPSIIMSKTKAQALRKEYEAAYRKDILHHYGGKEAYTSYMDTEKKYKDICELLGWKAETKPSKEKSRLSDMHKELAYEQKQVAKKAEKRKNWVGSEVDYYDKLVDEQIAKDELINQYYEYIKQSGLGAY